MTFTRPFLALTLAAAGAACEPAPHASSRIEIVDAGTDVGAACEPESSSEARADVLVLGDDSFAGCSVVAVRNGIRLVPSSDGSRPDPSWTSIVRDGSGRFYSAATGASGRGLLLVWGSDGKFLRTLGRQGEGPGELVGRGLPALMIGPGDSLIVNEASRWSVFGPDMEFGRVIVGPAVTRNRDMIHVLEDGRFLSTAPVAAGDPAAWFHLSGADGKLIRSFGPIEPPPADGQAPPRASALAGDGAFWVGPPPGAPGGYVLEQWSVDGQRLRSIERRVDWIVGEAPDPAARVPLPLFNAMHVDDAGRLWVMALVKDARWRPLQPGENDDELATELYDIRYEVIDPSAGAVLVSGVIDELPGEDERGWPPIGRFMNGSSMSYRPLPDSMGLETIEFYDVRLVASRGSRR